MKWVMENYSQVIQLLGVILVAGQMITRLTPTKADDGFLTRAGQLLDAACDFLHIPNARKQLDEIDKDVDKQVDDAA